MPLVQAILNDTYSSAVGHTSYEAAFGRPFQSLLTRSVSQVPDANHVSESYAEISGSVKFRLSKAQESYSRQANKHRHDVSFKEGDWVFLRIMKQRLKQVGKKCPKLSFRMYGPFPVISKVNDVSFRLQLPASWTMHNVFHVSWLKLFQGEPPRSVPDEEQPEIVDEAEVLEPEQILLHRFKHGSKKQKRQYFLKFKDRGTHEAAWVDEEFFSDYPLLLASYREAVQLGTGAST